jgi:HK97 family phage major capsid protein
MKDDITALLATFDKIERSIEDSKAKFGHTDGEIAQMREMLDGITTRLHKMEDAGHRTYQPLPTQNYTKRQKLCRWLGDMFLEQVRGEQPRWQTFYEAEMAEHRALDQEVGTVGSTDKGGILVPIPLIPEILGVTEQYGLARQLCRRMPMGQQQITIPIAKDNKPTVYWESEGATAKQTGVTFGTLTLTAKKMLVSSQLSSEVQVEAIIAIMDYLIDCLGRSAAEEEDRVFLTGSTSASPADEFNGVFTNCASTVFPIGTTFRQSQDQKVEAASGVTTHALFQANANGKSYDAIVDTLYRVDPTYQGSGTWVFHPIVEAMFRKIKDADNLPMWNAGLAGGQPGTILNRPYQKSLKAPLEATANGRLAVYGDFSQYAFATRESLEIAFNDSVGFLSDTRWVRMKQRVSLTCLDNHAFASLVLAGS